MISCRGWEIVGNLLIWALRLEYVNTVDMTFTYMRERILQDWELFSLRLFKCWNRSAVVRLRIRVIRIWR
jgi:hypothetical protein